jgi:hypothetical protein
MPQDDPGMPSCPSRRGVLTLGFGAVAAMTLAACGIRLEDDAPRIPLIPTRRPIPGESFLLSLWRHSDDLAVRATSLGGSATGLPARLAALHRRQVTVLESELLRLGVPRKVLDTAAATPSATTTGTASAPAAGTATTGATAPSGGPTGSATAAPSVKGPKGLAADEASDLGPTAVASLATVPSAAIPLIGSVLAQRAAAATMLGAPATWPEPSWSAPSLAASYLDSTRAAVYAFEVVAAQSLAGAQHTLALATLAALESRSQDQESLAGASAGPPDLGYPLPFPVTTAAAARKLAAQVLTELRASIARDLGSTGGDLGPLGALVQWLADTEVLGSHWGVKLSAFPGLT